MSRRGPNAIPSIAFVMMLQFIPGSNPQVCMRACQAAKGKCKSVTAIPRGSGNYLCMIGLKDLPGTGGGRIPWTQCQGCAFYTKKCKGQCPVYGRRNVAIFYNVHAIMLCRPMCDNLSVCVKLAYVDVMLYLYTACNILCCIDSMFMVFVLFKWRWSSCACESSFVCEISLCMHLLHCGTGKWRHLPNCSDSCDWSSHLWLRAGKSPPSSSMYLMILTCGLRGPILKTWYCSLDVLNDVWNASFSDIQSERPLHSMMVPSLPPTEPSHNAINWMHINFLHTWIWQWSHAREVWSSSYALHAHI
jgi:hypothetical protein